jgi:DNA-binding response OmpR family regulator
MSNDEKRPLGKILLQRKLVSQQELDAALRTQKRSVSPAPLASQLVDSGMVGEIDALRALSEQHGVPGMDLNQVAVVLEHLDVVPRELAETHLILPVLMKGDRIFLAMADPLDKRVVDEIEFVTGKKVYPYVAVHGTLMKTIRGAYDAKARGEHHYLGPNVPEETLRQLGITPPTPTVAVSGDPPAQGAVVFDQAIESGSLTSEVSTSEFGVVSEEVSSVERMPDELRAQASQAADAIVAGPGQLILVVDDEEPIRVMLKRGLTKSGYRVVEADRGLLALRLVKDHVPDLIILDAMLPELHGFDIAQRIKGSGKYGRIPIIMVSAVYRGRRVAEDLKRKYGVDEYVEKPFSMASILETVQRLLARSAERPSEPLPDPEYLSAEAENALREGISAYKAGRIDEAIEHLKRGIEIDPLSYRLHFHVALLFGKKGQVYEGIQELERAIDLYPTHFAALKNLAVLYEKAGFKNKAVAMWERCAAVAPDDATRATVKEHLAKLA